MFLLLYSADRYSAAWNQPVRRAKLPSGVVLAASFNAIGIIDDRTNISRPHLWLVARSTTCTPLAKPGSFGIVESVAKTLQYWNIVQLFERLERKRRSSCTRFPLFSTRLFQRPLPFETRPATGFGYTSSLFQLHLIHSFSRDSVSASTTRMNLCQPVQDS